MKDNSIITNPTTDELNDCKCFTTAAILNSTKVRSWEKMCDGCRNLFISLTVVL